MIPDNKIAQWKRINQDCDHAKHTELVNDHPCCFCSKFMDVIRHQTGASNEQFSRAVALHTFKNIPGDAIVAMYNQLVSKGFIPKWRES